jgi:DNA primase
MIPQSFIQDLLNRLDIVDVVESHLPLKRAGANLVACCPFHSEKSPSFTVSPAKQFYHCFGCGAHGNAIGFVMEYSGLGFVEAVKELSGRAGMTVPEVQGEAVPAPSVAVTRSIAEVLQAAAVHYRGELKRSDAAIGYLKGRGLTGEVAARFGLGFAPPGWQELAAVFPDYRAKALVDAGLVIEGDDGKRYDRFRDRIMFPIVNTRGDIVGFGGRVLGHGEPKYLNSPETPVFEKGREVYGLYQARGAIRASGRVIVVEGYMDVVALAQLGVNDAVATLGTATTPFHVQKLLKQSGRVVFCFDGDDAGRRAAWRALENCLGQLVDGKEVAFTFLPEGEDPDSYVRKVGREGFEARIRDALPLSGFLLRELSLSIDLATPEGRARLLQMAKPLVKQIAAPALAAMVRKRLAELGGLDQGQTDVLLGVQGGPRSRQSPERVRRVAPLSPQRRLLRCLLLAPRLAGAVDPILGDSRDADGRATLALVDFLAGNPQLSEKVLLAVVSDHFRGTVHEPVLNEAAAEIIEVGMEGFDAEAEFTGAIRQIKERCRIARLSELGGKPLASLSPDERSELQRLLAERGAAIGGPMGCSESMI